MKAENEFKNIEVNDLWELFGEVAQEEVFKVFDKQIKDLSRLVNAYKNRYNNLVTELTPDPENIEPLRGFIKSLVVLLDKYQKNVEEGNFSLPSDDYSDALEAFTKNIAVTLRRRELFSHYSIHLKDKPGVLSKKLVSNTVYLSQLNYKRVINVPRKLFKLKPFKLQTYRKRRIPYRAMVIDFLSIRLGDAMMASVHNLMKTKSLVLLKLWEFDEIVGDKIQVTLAKSNPQNIQDTLSPDEAAALFEELSALISAFRKALKLTIHQTLQAAIYDLDKAILRVDTPDLPLRTFHPRVLAIKRIQMLEFVNVNLKKWGNTHKTMLDDWGMDVEIVLLYISLLEKFLELEENINHFINNNLTLNFDQLRNFIDESSLQIQAKTSSTKVLSEILTKERQKVNDVLVDKLLAETIEKLSGSFTDDLERFKNSTLALAGKISNRRGFYNSKKYDRGIRENEIKYISPRDLLSFEALPHFEDAIAEIKMLVEKSLKRVRVKLLAVGTVSDFSLESALMMLGQKKGANKAAITIAIDGYERATGHLDEALSHTDTIKEEPLEKLHNAIHDLNIEIQNLKNTDNILELNIRIAKIKAIERSRKARRDAVQWVRNIIPEITAHLQKRFTETHGFLERVKNKLGIAADKIPISFEISEFIRQTEQALNKLPYVYQRLFQLKPTDEDRFFVNRLTEFEALEQAFTDWSKDRYVTIAITGEKGSGITSFLGFFLRKIDTNIPVIHHNVDYKIYLAEDYFEFFSKLLEFDNFESNDQIIQHLNKSTSKRMIIIENIHHFYLKKVNGFDCHKMYLDLIANTAKNVFWIGTYTIHTWDYLNKTIHVADHFVREIQLQQMSDQTLKEIIYKRNNLSGYKIVFLPSEANIESRTFMSMESSDKQQYLRKQYFNSLRSMSNGNISLAQLYWLRSINQISDDTISISTIRELDVSFVRGFTNDYIFAVHAILIHDGLSLEEYAKVFAISQISCRQILIPMHEKGLLIKPKEKYNINPIIFRQVVALLHSRNFIY